VRGRGGVLAEETGKVRGIGKTELLGDLLDRLRGENQLSLGLGEQALTDQMTGGHAGRAFDVIVESTDGHAEFFCIEAELMFTAEEFVLKQVPYLDKVLFANSGGEAVEAAMKFARAATGRSGIVYCDHAFHGVSYGALSINGDEAFRSGFGPFVPDCVRIPFNDLVALEQALNGGTVAAFIVEPIQGKGVNMPAVSYLKNAAALCRRHGTLFIADEVQTGLGRTGRFLAVEHWNVEPDMVLLSKHCQAVTCR